MIRTPQELSRPIRQAVDRRAVFFSHIVLGVVIALHTYLDPTSTSSERIMGIVLGATLIGLIVFRTFDLARINEHPFIYMVIYEIFVFVGITFLSDAATPYAVGVFIVVFIANLYYGSRGVWITVAVFGATTIAKLIYMTNTGQIDNVGQMNILATFFVFLAACSFFIHVQSVFDWDHARLKSTIRKSFIEQKRLSALINNMTESVLVLDKVGVVKLYNAAALSLFDTNISLEDKKPGDFAKMETDKGKPISFDELLSEGPNPVTRSDIKLMYENGDSASISLTVTPLKTTFGERESYAGYILTMRDITREKSLEEERNEFISVISHELRTPVTVTEASLSNAIVFNERNGGNEEVKKTLEVAHDQALYLAHMLNDLSTFARAEKGLLELNLEEINPRELIEHLATDYRNEAEVKGLNIQSRIEEPITENIISNRLYIREILQNFISNAIKYSDNGTITIIARPDEEGKIRFSVKDEGIGISTSDQKKVFNKFFRSEDYRTRSRSGTGLGLYIVRKLAKLLQANFDLESEVGKGSTFSLVVPNLKHLQESREHHNNQNPPTNLPSDSAENKDFSVLVKNSKPALTEQSESINSQVSQTEKPHPKHKHASRYHVHHLQKQR
jgi:two-component system phosphate regulon sensor histidine kinase PhoR